MYWGSTLTGHELNMQSKRQPKPNLQYLRPTQPYQSLSLPFSYSNIPILNRSNLPQPPTALSPLILLPIIPIKFRLLNNSRILSLLPSLLPSGLPNHLFPLSLNIPIPFLLTLAFINQHDLPNLPNQLSPPLLLFLMFPPLLPLQQPHKTRHE